MRYSITNTTIEQVQSVGAKNIKLPVNIPTVFADLTADQITKLQEMGCIISQISTVQATIDAPLPVEAQPIYTPEELGFVTGIEEFREIFSPPLYGEGFNIAIIDTGIRETHQLIKGRVVYSKNYSTSPMRDGFDHGTAVASIIAAITPQIGILDLKVLGDDGSGTEEIVTGAIDDCIELHRIGSPFAPAVINMSLGSIDDGNPNTAIRIACRAAIDAGIWILAAAGNGGPYAGTVTSPAVERYVGAVGSIGYEPFTVSDYSSRGPTIQGIIKPDLMMFGENIVLASSRSDSATRAKSGTSFSTAFVSSMSAIYIEGAYRQAVIKQELYPGAQTTFFFVTEQELIDTYLALICVKPEGSLSGKDIEYGYGLPYGPLTAKAMGFTGGVASGMSGLITSMMAVGMMGMMMKSIK